MQPSHDDSTNSIKAVFKQGGGTGTRAAYLPVTPDIMIVSQAKGRGLVLRGVALHQQDATDQEGSLEEIPPYTAQYKWKQIPGFPGMYIQ